MAEQQSLLAFPCEFALKALGKNHSEINLQVFNIVRRHIPCLKPNNISIRQSKGGKYIAITVNIQATSKSQLDRIYQDLTNCNLIIMTL